MNTISTTPHSARPARALTIAALILWFLLALYLSISGAFDSRNRPPLGIGAAAVLPVAGFALAYFGSKRFRDHVLAADVRLLTLAQTWRIGGVVLVVLYLRGMLPGAFALPAGLGDVAIGATAPWIAWLISSRRRGPYRAFYRWSALGILDLVTAVTLGILSSASPLGILASDVTTEVMGRFPMSMIPTFFVPLLLILHLIGLAIVRRNRPIAPLANP